MRKIAVAVQDTDIRAARGSNVVCPIQMALARYFPGVAIGVQYKAIVFSARPLWEITQVRPSSDAVAFMKAFDQRRFEDVKPITLVFDVPDSVGFQQQVKALPA